MVELNKEGGGNATDLRSMGTLRFNLLNPMPLADCDCGRCESRCESSRLENEGFGIDSGKGNSSGRDMVSALRMEEGRWIGGKSMSS
jgi:hypothetical protein